MLQLSAIQQVAEQVLLVPGPNGHVDRFLLDRAQRLLRHCASIAQLDDVRCFQVDRDCLAVAALFRDAGFARYAGEADQVSRVLLAELTDHDLRDFSTQIVHERLAELLNPRQLERVCSTIIESGSRTTRLIEAMILSDARNLDDMGAAGIFNAARRYGVHGRGVTEAVQAWRRKVDYDYWTARLREGFRFESVRGLARGRLQGAIAFMDQLARENRAADLEDLLLEQHLGEPDRGAATHELDQVALTAVASTARRQQLAQAGGRCDC